MKDLRLCPKSDRLLARDTQMSVLMRKTSSAGRKKYHLARHHVQNSIKRSLLTGSAFSGLILGENIL